MVDNSQTNLGLYDTPLKPGDEYAYQMWLQSIGMTHQNGMAVTPDGTGTDYDLRGFFNKYGAVDIRGGKHFTDEFKKPNHPGFSDQSIYSKGSTKGGTWKGDTFVPSDWNKLVRTAKQVSQGQQYNGVPTDIAASTYTNPLAKATQ